MRFVTASELKPGMVLARDILTSNSSFFLTASGYVIPKLVAFILVLAVAVFIFFMMEKFVSMDLIIGREQDKEKKIDGVKALKMLFSNQ